MKSNIAIEETDNRWNLKSWLWVLLCSFAIFSSIPLARKIQFVVYDKLGREFFSYSVLFVIIISLIALLYLFIARLRIRNISQYIWLIAWAIAMIYSTVQLRTFPEEAVHLLEYGILSIFVFRALSYRIHDWTIYIIAALIVSIIGTADEIIQWLIPSRYWGYKDVGINTLAGVFFLLAISKGIKPKVIRLPVKKHSVDMLMKTTSVFLIILGLCLSNTTDAVKNYTDIFKSLSWLKSEELMTEYGYKHSDADIGTFYSRFTIDSLRNIDSAMGITYGEKLLDDIAEGAQYDILFKTYDVYTHKFLREFLSHMQRRDLEYEIVNTTRKQSFRIAGAYIAFKENSILEKYFKNTLINSGSKWSDGEKNKIEELSSLSEGNYKSTAGKLITLFSLREVWIFIITALLFIQLLGRLWGRRLIKLKRL